MPMKLRRRARLAVPPPSRLRAMAKLLRQRFRQLPRRPGPVSKATVEELSKLGIEVAELVMQVAGRPPGRPRKEQRRDEVRLLDDDLWEEQEDTA